MKSEKEKMQEILEWYKVWGELSRLEKRIRDLPPLASKDEKVGDTK